MHKMEYVFPGIACFFFVVVRSNCSTPGLIDFHSYSTDISSSTAYWLSNSSSSEDESEPGSLELCLFFQKALHWRTCMQ